jgi:hypothetical protein
MDLVEDDIDFAFYLTMYEVLEEVIVHCGQAQNCTNDHMLEAHIKMASRAMRCALQVYLDRLEEAEMQKRKSK